jgi:hypothetical protein
MALTDAERRIVHALGQTMFPRDGVVPLDGDDAAVADWVDDYAARMPPLSRTQIRALLRTFDLGFGVWVGRPRETFANARPDVRAAYLESWEHSTTYTQRMLYEALRSFLSFAYVESPAVRAAIAPGETWGERAWRERAARAAGSVGTGGAADEV